MLPVSVLLLFMCTLHVGLADYHASNPLDPQAIESLLEIQGCSKTQLCRSWLACMYSTEKHQNVLMTLLRAGVVPDKSCLA